MKDCVKVIDADRWREFRDVVPGFQMFEDSVYYLHDCPVTDKVFLVEVSMDDNIAEVFDISIFLASIQHENM